jgi:hypothetical protein
MWLDQSMQWLGKPSGKRGRSPPFSDFCLSIKCLFGPPLRQALGMVQSLLRLAKLDWPVPDFRVAGGQHRHQVPRRVRMEAQEAWRRVPA